MRVLELLSLLEPSNDQLERQLFSHAGSEQVVVHLLSYFYPACACMSRSYVIGDGSLSLQAVADLLHIFKSSHIVSEIVFSRLNLMKPVTQVTMNS